MHIDREELDKYLNVKTNYISTLESDGHTGVNIKIPVEKYDLDSIIEYYEIFYHNIFKKISKRFHDLTEHYIDEKKEIIQYVSCVSIGPSDYVR